MVRYLASFVWVALLAFQPDLQATLTEDSTAFAHYWELVESGQTDSAQSYLSGLGDSDPKLEHMANFRLALRAFTTDEFDNVLAYLDLGIPSELTDHGLWMRAWALTESQQTELAVPYWRQILLDRTSVRAADAILELAAYYSSTGAIDSALSLLNSANFPALSAEAKLKMKLVKADLLGRAKRHREAMDALWSIFVSSPRSADGKEARDRIRGYERLYGFAPRGQTPEEFRDELRGIEAASQWEAGLARLSEAEVELNDPLSREAMSFYRGRFQVGMKRYRDGISTLNSYLLPDENRSFRTQALFQIGRSAYMIDDDTTAYLAFQQLSHCTNDSATVCEGMELWGLLLQDRGRSQEAVECFAKWLEMERDDGGRSDALWRLGWAYWDTGNWAAAADNWERLSTVAAVSEYRPASLYWVCRAAEKSGQTERARSAEGSLLRDFSHSYYAVLRGDSPWSGEPRKLDLVPMSLDYIASGGDAKCGKFALLAAMRATEFAMLELPGAASELKSPASWSWWKAQLEIWNGNRLNAWRIVRAELGDYIRSAGQRPRAFYDVVYPLDYDPWIADLAREHNLDPYFVFALICQESHFEEEIVSSAGAVGLMQLMPATARIEAASLGIPYRYDGLSEAKYNLQLGTAHVARLAEEFDADSVLMLAAYNAGKEVVHKWVEKYQGLDRDVFIEKIPYRETRLFVKRNIEHKAAYHRFYPDVVPVNAAESGTGRP